ncbi:pimeloyl-ACP methyl ester carboxylesterase [Catenulispora sp. EB89]|uniref:alpha/beta fold hydrolase n=1 Tax=Catenulispora sp. EB89 TaxID=3156257 RepID=UPI00351891E2
MARLLGVCGTGNDPRKEPPQVIQVKWQAALMRGVEQAGGSPAYVEDLVCVTYADLLETSAPATPTTSPTSSPSPCGTARMVRFLSEVHAYVANLDVRHRVRERIATQIGPDTHIIVGHSLGAATAYEALALLPHHNVHTLITLGSPLGYHRYLLRPSLMPNDQHRYPWPPGLQRWINLYDRKDPFVVRKRLKPLFGDGHQVEDYPVRNGLALHAAGAYLSTFATGCAIVAQSALL